MWTRRKLSSTIERGVLEECDETVEHTADHFHRYAVSLQSSSSRQQSKGTERNDLTGPISRGLAPEVKGDIRIIINAVGQERSYIRNPGVTWK
jgi:hypothetical protein